LWRWYRPPVAFISNLLEFLFLPAGCGSSIFTLQIRAVLVRAYIAFVTVLYAARDINFICP
jgi:hypothetical protein